MATPVRSHMDDPNTKWRYGKAPVYTVVNETYMEGKTQNHAEGSLEKIVENLVKTWEMEATHKMDPKDWKTVNHEKFFISMNNGKQWSMKDILERGTYNLFMKDSVMYDSKKHTFQSSHDLFKTAMPRGFAWEVLKVFCGPPNVVFTWRHWGYWEGPYEDKEPKNEKVELFGISVATLNDQNKLEGVEFYFDPTQFMANFNVCPMHKN